jgi:hypothetical protein
MRRAAGWQPFFCVCSKMRRCAPPFKQYLIAALDLGERASYIADTLLWGEPRPLFLEVIPTALRQLETNWQRTTEGDAGAWQYAAWEDSIADRPLPDYVPPALFSDLKSPDVLIRIPERRVEADEKTSHS